LKTLKTFFLQYDTVALGLVLGLLISFFYSSILPIFQIKYKVLVNGIDGYVGTKIQNKLVREAVLHAILLAQKEMASENGEERFKRAKEYLLKKCPDILEGAADKILQSLYDEFVHANLIDGK
jgi:uncharacterized protein YacL